MAGFLICTIGFLCIAREASAAAPVMRRDSLEQVSLTAAGAATGGAKAKHRDSHHLATEKKLSSQNKDVGEAGTDYCNWDFPLGVDMTNDCHVTDPETPVNKGGAVRIDQLSDCMVAAGDSGANWTIHHEVPFDFFGRHPEGCFKDNCSAANAWDNNSTEGAELAQSICYFFNPSPTTPLTTTIESGTPVCRRNKIVLGETLTGTVPAENGGCPVGYEVVRYQSTCHHYAQCIGREPAQYFRTNDLNASLRDIFPDFCYLETVPTGSTDDPKVFYNAPRPGMADPTKPVGVPICNVSSITLWNGQQPEPEIGPFEENPMVYATAPA